MKRTFLIILVVCLVLGCGSSKKVSRIESKTATQPETTTDLSSKWDNTDSRLVVREMMADCLSRAWIPAYVGVTGDKPVVTVGPVHNRTGERIDVKNLITNFEKELKNSDQINFIACQNQRDEISDEGQKEQEYASHETIRRIRAETGANFILVGALKSITDVTGGTKVAYYQTDLEMINTKTMAKVWAGTKRIKKEVFRKKTKS